jgi:hypothetical protein
MNGGMTPTMIRNFKRNIQVESLTIADVLKDYCLDAIVSVDDPSAKRQITFDGTRMFFISRDYDVLSPPLFQDATNSMGFFKEAMSAEESEYGEPIVEVRAIKDISAKFLENAGLETGRVGFFLTNTNGQFIQETLALFEFLDRFGSKNIVDFSVGLPYAVLRGSF